MTTLEKVEQTGTSVETSGDARRLNALYKQCQRLAASDLVPKALRGKPDNVFALALYGDRYGLSPVHAVQRIYLVEGSFMEKAEVLGGVVMRAGHDLQWDEVSAERCTVSIRRRGSDKWQSTTWTIDDARRAGLLDVWVERRTQDGTWPNGDKKWKVDKFVVGDDAGVFTAEERARRALGPMPDWAQQLLDAGDVHRRDGWAQYPGDHLAAKALRRAAKRIVGDALLGFDPEDDRFEPLTPEKVVARQQADVGHGDDGFTDPSPDGDRDGGEPTVAPEPTDDDDDADGAGVITDAEIVHDDDQPPPADDELDPAAQQAQAIKSLMATCGKAFPERDAARGEKTRRQRILRRAAQHAVLGEHKPASSLTIDELKQVERWVWISFLGDVSPHLRYEVCDDGRVKFAKGDRVKYVPAIDDETPSAA